MIVSINQPAYLPWDGYFDRIRQSDLHIVLDHVQLEKGGFTNRTRIRQRDGRVMWLTIPVEKGRPINETRIVGDAWRRKHQKALRQAYGDEAVPWWLSKDDPDDEIVAAAAYLEIDLTPRRLVDVCFDSAKFIFQWIPHSPPVRWSSDLGGSRLGAKSDLVLNLCKEVGATTYLSGPNGRDYLNLPDFDKAGIQVTYHDYPIVQPVLSAIHTLFA